jgi:hypothetical protein
MRVPFSLHPHQYLLVVVFLIMAIPTGVRKNVSVVLICISFMARDGEHQGWCFFLSILTSSSKRVLFSSVAHFFIDSLIFEGV